MPAGAPDHPLDGPLDGDPDADAAPAPAPRPRRPREPLISVRRVVMVVAVAAALAVFVWGTHRTQGTDGITAADDPAVLAKVPEPGDRVVPQARVGAELKPTYWGNLVIDGKPIPDDQLEGSVPIGSPEYTVKEGSRANNKSRVYFVPGPGKAVAKLRTGEVRIVLEFWKIADGPHPKVKQRIAWTILVS